MMRVLMLVAWTAMSASAQQIDTVIPAPAPQVLELNGITGSVRIATWSRPEIRVQAQGVGASRVRLIQSARGVNVREGTPEWTRVEHVDTVRLSNGMTFYRRDAARFRMDTSAAFPDTNGNLTMRIAMTSWVPPTQEILPTAIDYIITVPRHVRVVVRASTSDIIVDGAVDSLDLSTIKGSIRASNLRGISTLNSLEGRILAEGIRGDLRASTLGGRIVVREAEGTVNAQAVAGSIDLFNVRSSRITASTYEGGISLKGRIDPRAAVALSTRSGPIALPAGSPCEDAPAGTTQVIRSGQSNNGNFMVVITKRDSTSVTSFAGPLTCTLRRD